MAKRIDFSNVEGLNSLFNNSLNSEFESFEKPLPGGREKFQAAKTAAQDIVPLAKCPHFRFDRSKTGKELAEALKESLSHQGINPDDLMVRYFSNHAIGNLVSTGTDRDRTSKTGNRDGEET